MINNKKTFRINEVKQIEVRQKEIDTVEKIKAVLDSIGEVSTLFKFRGDDDMCDKFTNIEISLYISMTERQKEIYKEISKRIDDEYFSKKIRGEHEKGNSARAWMVWNKSQGSV